MWSYDRSKPRDIHKRLTYVFHQSQVHEPQRKTKELSRSKGDQRDVIQDFTLLQRTFGDNQPWPAEQLVALR
jgi:hypothetical protein